MCVYTKDIALMNEREREGFIRKIGISADDTDESDDDEENDSERHKYNCKKCQVSISLHTQLQAVYNNQHNKSIFLE